MDDDPAASSLALTADAVVVARRQGQGRHAEARRRGQGRHPPDDRQGRSSRRRRSSSSRPRSRHDGDGLAVSGDLTIGGKSKPVTFVARGEKGIARRQHDDQAERLGHQAVLGAVRRAQGQRRGRGRGRGHARLSGCVQRRPDLPVAPRSGEPVAAGRSRAPSAGRGGAGTVILPALSSGRFAGRADPGKERDCAGIGTIRVLLSGRRDRRRSVGMRGELHERV